MVGMIPLQLAFAFMAAHKPERIGHVEAILFTAMPRKSGEWSCLATDTLSDLHATGEVTRVIPRQR